MDTQKPTVLVRIYGETRDKLGELKKQHGLSIAQAVDALVRAEFINAEKRAHSAAAASKGSPKRRRRFTAPKPRTRRR